MADEEKNEKEEETKGEAQEPEAPKKKAPKKKAPKEDSPAASDESAEQAPKEPSPSAPEPDGGGREAEQPSDDLGHKERRRLERSRADGSAKPQRSAEERAKERVERRREGAVTRGRYRKRSRGKRTEPGTGTPPADRRPVGRKVRQGIVVSNKTDKTITVRIDVARRHPVYQKIVPQSSTLHAHDESNQAQEGDTVRVVETRPLSRSKRWRLVEVVTRAR